VVGGNCKGNKWYTYIKQRKQALIIILAKKGHNSLRTVNNVRKYVSLQG
jgi:hypothetical protein